MSRNHIAILLLLLLAIVAQAGCTTQNTTVVHDDMDFWHKLQKEHGGPKPSVQAGGDPTTPSDSGDYSILLHTFTGKMASIDAQRYVRGTQENTKIADLWVYPDGDQVQVQRGHYLSPDEPQALNDLRQTRLARINGAYPFADAQIITVNSQAKPVSAPTDLRQFTGMHGYTLQVAFFNAAGGSTYKEAAEAYCRQLCEKGEKAFFYHGPRNSMVTIGLFNDDDFVKDGQAMVYGPRVRELQERYPYNVGNGATVIEKVNGRAVDTQHSELVALPRN